MRRALFSLRPGVCGETVLRYVAKLSEGNARIAIQTLRNAAYIADNEQSPNIKLVHIKNGYNSSKDLEKSYLLDRLNSHQRLLYELVKENNEINSGELWKLYLEKCRKLQKHPIAMRTYSEYMNKLIELELVHWDRALVKGKVRVFSVSA
jgi:Cdc6-like AAA superfamily ATPase